MKGYGKIIPSILDNRIESEHAILASNKKANDSPDTNKLLRLKAMNNNPIIYLSHWAKMKPNSKAIVSPKFSINYKNLNELVLKISQKLSAHGICEISSIVTCFAKKEIEWILTLALMRLGCTSGSNHGYSNINEIDDVDWVISDKELPFKYDGQVIIVTGQWLNELPTDFAFNKFSEHIINQRFSLTSGTTGQPKTVYRSYNQLISSAKAHCCTNPVYSSTVELMRLSAGGGFTQALAMLISGSALYCSHGPQSIYNIIKKHRIACISGSPTQIGSLIQHMHQNNLEPLNIKLVKYSGSQASKKLIGAIHHFLSPKIYTTYGSTEAGGIAGMYIDEHFQENVVGYVFPNVQVEIIKDGQPVIDEPGIVRIQSMNMVQHYHNHAEASSEVFKDGWFYPGDRGLINKDGMLSILGREKDFINKGGVKIDPAQIDLTLINHPDIEDAAIFSFDDHLGVPQIAAAVVTNIAVDFEKIGNYLSSLHGSKAPKYYIKAGKIPRNHMGKVMRKELKEKFESALINKLILND